MNSDERRDRAREIFFACLRCETAQERAQLVSHECAGDSELESAVVSLLEVHEANESFLEKPLDGKMAVRAAGGSAATLDLPQVTEQPGTVIGPYTLLQQIAEGGMGVVYIAEQEKPVARKVALKVIKPGMDTKEVIARFEAERQALAMMDHPHIAKVFDAGSTDSGRPYFVMELVRGTPVTEYCDRKRLTVRERLALFVTVCQAVQHAHQKGIIHRDVKPSNVLITEHDGAPAPKVIDFGVAKAVSGRLTEETFRTRFQQLVGTPLYMSPEQAELGGLDVDTRSDIYSLGVLLYELFTGTTPFDRTRFHDAAYDEIRCIIREEDSLKPSTRISTLGDTAETVCEHRQTDPKRLRQLLRGELDWIAMKALEKDRTRRYQTALDFAQDVQRSLNHQPVQAGPTSTTYRVRKFIRRHKAPVAVAAMLALFVLTSGVLTSMYIVEQKKVLDARKKAFEAQQTVEAREKTLQELEERQRKQRWAREEIIPEIRHQLEDQDYFAAFLLGKQIEGYLPGDPTLAELSAEYSRTLSIVTNPPGAHIYMKDRRSTDDDWQYLGLSPLDQVNLPNGAILWKLTKEAFETQHRLDHTAVGGGERSFMLETEAESSGMVRIPAGRWRNGRTRLQLTGFEHLDPVPLGEFFIDRHEVTNRQFKHFVDSGGYQTREYWKHQFVKDNAVLTWDEAMREFRDATGSPGPATWKAGRYADGQDDYPATGVNWYEAAAYAEFVGKSLPNIYQWSLASAPWVAPHVVPLSNFDRQGPTPVGNGLGVYGTYDMAGNAKEWCWNEAGDNKRYILGGGWNEPSYMAYDADTRPPFDRSPELGFRCVKYLVDNDEPPAEALNEVLFYRRDFSQETPCSDEAFLIYKRMYSYDKGELNAEIVSTEQSKQWVHEIVEFDAAYGEERVIAHLFLPINADGPFQTLVYFPGSGVIYRPFGEDPWGVQPLVDSGRAVLCPIYKGMYDRPSGLKSDIPDTTSLYRDHVIQWSKDLGRSIDYLEQREDIDHDKLAYFGVSWGPAMGAILLALEDRLKVSVLAMGGFYFQETSPEVDPINFAPRVTIPTLMINGRYDSYFPLETSQRPMFDLLGTPAKDKHLAVFETNHVVELSDIMEQTLAWLDRYLGPVEGQ